MVLGGIAWTHDRIRRAVGHGLAASNCEMSTPELVCDAIAALIQVGESAAANRLFEHGVLHGNQLAVPLLMRLSGQAQANGEHARSLEFLERAGKKGARGAEYQSYLGVQLAFNGRLVEAERELESCVHLDPTSGRAALILSRLRTQTTGQNHLQNLAVGLEKVRPETEERAALGFALYKELEDLGRYEEAWNALSKANRVMQGLLQHDPATEDGNVTRLIRSTSDWTAPKAENLNTGPRPIFIVGMPRSGTTLLDRILGNHSCVANAGELSDFGRQLCWVVDHRTPLIPDATALDRLVDIDFAELGQRYLLQTQWRAGDKPFYVDKLPANWVVSGLIARALPQARILHMTRDPMEVCFSNYRALFGDSYQYSYDLTSLAQHHANYRRIMAHWHRAAPGRIMDVAYHDLVDDAPSVARRVFDFCGLEFESGCTDVTRNQGAVATLSMVQARNAINNRNVGQWRPYAPWLQPLQEALRDGA